MNALTLLEELGKTEPVDAEVFRRTADTLLAAAAAEGGVRGAVVAPAVVDVVPLHDRDDHGRGPGPAPAPSGIGRGGRRRWLVRAAAVVVVVGTVSGVSSVGVLHPGSPGAPGSAAAAVLGHLADVAAGQPASAAPGPGQYVYTDSIEAYTDSTYDLPPDDKGSYTVLVPEHRQIWIGPDGSGRLFETFGQPAFLSAQDRADWVAVGSPVISTAPSDQTYGAHGLGFMNLSGLPTDPSTLAALISSRKIEGGPPGPAEDFAQIGDLLRETSATPALRSALYQVAAGLPGVTSLGTVTDHSGRPGIGLAEDSGGTEHELIFDPTTSALLGEQYVVVGPSADEPLGTVVGWVVYLQSTIVDSITSTGPSTPAVPISPPSSSSTTPSGQSSSSGIPDSRSDGAAQVPSVEP